MSRFLVMLAVSAVQCLGEGAVSAPSLLDFSLHSSAAEIQKRLGPPEHIVAGRAYQLLQYNLGSADVDDLAYGWTFYFEQPSGQLLSITRNLQPAAPVMSLLPDGESRTVFSPDPARLPIRYRLLSNARVLLGIGITSARDQCAQIILIRRSAVSRFYPWLSAQVP